MTVCSISQLMRDNKSQAQLKSLNLSTCITKLFENCTKYFWVCSQNTSQVLLKSVAFSEIDSSSNFGHDLWATV